MTVVKIMSAQIDNNIHLSAYSAPKANKGRQNFRR